MTSSVPVARRGRTIVRDGRAKAYRPLPVRARFAAFESGLASYDRGDFFAAHEHLEPAWMGTDDPAERDLHQGLIKLAAAFVHGVRGNPAGIRKNLIGARSLLASALASDPVGQGRFRRALDVAAIVASIDDRLARLGSDPTAAVEPVLLTRAVR